MAELGKINRRKTRPVRGMKRPPQIVNVYGLGLGSIFLQYSNYGNYGVMEAKRLLNLKMDGKNEWRIDTSVAIKQNDTNTSYGLRYLLNHQLPTAETPGKEHFNISSVSYSVFLGLCQLQSIL